MLFALIDTPIYLFLILFVVLPIWFLWVAMNRAGQGGAWALLSLIPFGFIIVLGIHAFSEWPALKRDRSGVT